MIRTLALLLVCFVLATLVLVTGCGGQNQIIINPQREPGTMSGYVKSIVNDSPVGLAKVHLISSPFTEGTEGETVSTTVYTDQFGRYTTSIPFGRIVVVVLKDGYKPPDPQLWCLSPAGDGRLDFTLVPGENTQEIDPRIHDPFCLTCHYQVQIPDTDNDGKSAYPPEGTGKG